MKSSILLLLLGVSSLFLVWEMLLTSGKSMNLVFIAIVNSSLFPALGVWSPSHRTTREVPALSSS